MLMMILNMSLKLMSLCG